MYATRLGSLAAWETPQGALLEYSEWWRTERWWDHYPTKPCRLDWGGFEQAPMNVVIAAFQAASREELIVFLSLLAQMHDDYAPSVATLLRPTAQERDYLVRLVTAAVGGSDCYVSSGSARVWGRPSNVEEHVSERFREMLARVTGGPEPEPTPGGGAVYVGPGATEPADLPPAPTGPRPGEPVYEIPGIDVTIDRAGMSPWLIGLLAGGLYLASRKRRR